MEDMSFQSLTIFLLCITYQCICLTSRLQPCSCSCMGWSKHLSERYLISMYWVVMSRFLLHVIYSLASKENTQHQCVPWFSKKLLIIIERMVMMIVVLCPMQLKPSTTSNTVNLFACYKLETYLHAVTMRFLVNSCLFQVTRVAWNGSYSHDIIRHLMT